MIRLNISFHTSRMIALSDLCKLTMPVNGTGTLWINRVIISNIRDTEVDCFVYLEHECGTIPLAKYTFGNQCLIDIPDTHRTIENGRWTYLRLDAEKVRSSTESPHELALYVDVSYCQRDQTSQPSEKIDAKI